MAGKYQRSIEALTKEPVVYKSLQPLYTTDITLMTMSSTVTFFNFNKGSNETVGLERSICINHGIFYSQSDSGILHGAFKLGIQAVYQEHENLDQASLFLITSVLFKSSDHLLHFTSLTLDFRIQFFSALNKML